MKRRYGKENEFGPGREKGNFFMIASVRNQRGVQLRVKVHELTPFWLSVLVEFTLEYVSGCCFEMQLHIVM